MTVAADAPAIRLAPASNMALIFSSTIRPASRSEPSPQTDHFAGFECQHGASEPGKAITRPAEAIGCGHGAGPLSGNRDQTEIFHRVFQSPWVRDDLNTLQILRTRPRDC